MIQSYKDLIVWQKGFQLVIAVYRLTKEFPKTELFGLTSQMRRAAVSVASNIAEGYSRRSDKEFNRFLLIAIGSASELETQLLVAKELGLSSVDSFVESEKLIKESMKLINCFINKLKN
ncbi:MAG: four helix bundle protein [Patescibacteria group bacterium]|jgi:four helix bundle protein